jgi:betaine lipid synthase
MGVLTDAFNVITYPIFTLLLGIALVAGLFLTFSLLSLFDVKTPFPSLTPYIRFVYGCFLKPHGGDTSGRQQDALESFYAAQAEAYDQTRERLLRGRKEMLGLVAAQLKVRRERDEEADSGKPIWVDVS